MQEIPASVLEQAACGSHPPLFSEQGPDVAVHVCPLPAYPLLHVQTAVPLLFAQVAF
jgi:hypothetical protein